MNSHCIHGLITLHVILFLTACGGGGGGTTDDSSGPIPVSGTVPDTGQTYCYYDYTIEIIDSTGKDGIYNPSESTCLPDSAWVPHGQDGYDVSNEMAFSDNGNGTLLDMVTGLTWQKCTLGRSGDDCSMGSSISVEWSSAKEQCAILGTGWRLPTVSELTRIVNYGRSYSSIDETAFPNTAPSPYWSSTAHPSYTGYAWYVNFGQGDTWLDVQTDPHYVRCVRG